MPTCYRDMEMTFGAKASKEIQKLCVRQESTCITRIGNWSSQIV